MDNSILFIGMCLLFMRPATLMPAQFLSSAIIIKLVPSGRRPTLGVSINLRRSGFLMAGGTR